jgi:photoactive yellow protein
MIGLQKFDTEDIGKLLGSKMSNADIEKLAFGAVQLDATGKILAYNSAEGEITGRKAQDVIGKNFFKDVAPCTNTPKFQGVFAAGVKAGQLSAMFDYVFDYNMKPTRVNIHMKKAMTGETYWIFVRRMQAV